MAPEQVSIKEHQIQLIDVDLIKTDPDNPNVMDEQQMQALEESLRFYGNVHPVTVDQNYLIADGEHRYRVYKRMGMKQIPCFVVQMDDAQRRLFRQIANKLSGKHDVRKDLADLELLMGTNADDLKLFLNIDDRAIKEMRALVVAMDANVETDDDIDADRMDSFLNGNIKQIVLVFDNDTYKQIMPRVEKVMKGMDVKEPTVMFMNMLAFWEAGHTQ